MKTDSHKTSINRLLFALLLSLAVLGLIDLRYLLRLSASTASAAGYSHVARMIERNAPLSACERASPFLIAPMVHGLGEAENKTAHGAANQPSSEILLRRLLDEIKPAEAIRKDRSPVELGYTLPIPLWALGRLDGNGWAPDEAKLNFFLDLVRHIDRPVVVTLGFNHFSSDTPLVRALGADPANLMQLPDGSVPLSVYFSTVVVPFTLSTDPQLSANQVRFGLLEKVLAALKNIDRQYPGRIRAVTLSGEMHHLTADLYNNNGLFTPYAPTDYSPLAVREFRAWAKTRYQGSLDLFNSAAGTHFSSWDDIEPPRKNIRHDKLAGIFEHIDSYAHGILPVFGWLDTTQPVEKIEIWVDGHMLAQAEQGFGRLDVPESVAYIRDPNTGFRVDLDTRQWSRGRHRLQVLAYPRGREPFIISEREVIMMGQSQESAPDVREPDRFSELKRGDNWLRTWLDHPPQMIDLYYNPLARIWQDFREYQVENYLRTVWYKAVASGFDPNRLYSHQILPDMETTWNRTVPAASLTQRPDSPYQKGITLYGGLTHSEKVLDRIGAGQGQQGHYGVPEFNLLQDKDPNAPLLALDFHRRHCADFVSPYFMTLDLGDKFTKENSYSTMLIGADATRPNGINLYKAIKKLLRE